MQLINTISGYEAIIVDQVGQLHYSTGLQQFAGQDQQHEPLTGKVSKLEISEMVEFKMKISNKKITYTSLVLIAFVLSACSGGSGDSDQLALDGSTVGQSDTNSGTLVNADFSIAYVDRSVESAGNPTDGIIFNAGGDLIIKDLASPSASEKNITTEIYSR